MGRSQRPAVEALEGQFLELKRQIELLEQEKKVLGEKLIALMTSEGLKETPGECGTGLRLSEKLDCTYAAEVYEYVERNGLAPLFTAPFKISHAKVMQLNKKNALTLAQFTRIQKGAGAIEKIYTLSQFKRQEADAG